MLNKSYTDLKKDVVTLKSDMGGLYTNVVRHSTSLSNLTNQVNALQTVIRILQHTLDSTGRSDDWGVPVKH